MMNASMKDVCEGKAPDDGLCAADEYKGTVDPQVWMYSSAGLPQMKDRCEVNSKDVHWTNSEVYRLKEYMAGNEPNLLIVFPPFVCAVNLFREAE